MATTAQIIANQANARKSSGPKTAEGKDASRRNALTHGMAARTLVLPDEEGAVIAARIVAWTPVLLPQDEYDDWLVAEMAVSSVRIDRCRAHESALRIRQADRAALCWDIDRECEAEDLGDRLAKAPAKVAGTLRRTKQGCAWLIARWEGLSRVLQANGDWDAPQQRLALDLLGTPKELREGPTPIDGDRPALIREQVAHLNAVKAGALDELDERERADAEIGLGGDTDQSIALARRYEAACLRRLKWAQAQLPQGRLAIGDKPREPEPVAVEVDVEVAEPRVAAEVDRLRAIPETPAPPAPARAFESPAPPPPTVAPRGNRKARRARLARARKS